MFFRSEKAWLTVLSSQKIEIKVAIRQAWGNQVWIAPRMFEDEDKLRSGFFNGLYYLLQEGHGISISVETYPTRIREWVNYLVFSSAIPLLYDESIANKEMAEQVFRSILDGLGASQTTNVAGQNSQANRSNTFSPLE